MEPAARFGCALASADRDEPLLATASQVPEWLLVEVGGPWGRDAITQSDLGPHAPHVWREAMRRRGIRVIAIRRDLQRSDGPIRVVHVVAARPGERAGSCRTRTIDHLHELVAATEGLAAGYPPEWKHDPARYVLVCTNGRHDPCCATFGRPLARSLRESRWAPDVWECSHIGGDRFAGNVVVLPDGLYFGRRDPGGAARVLDALDHGRLDLEGFRGRSTFRLAEQAAEHFVRVARELDALDAVRGIERVDDSTLRVDVVEDGEPATYRVTIERTTVPAATPLTCTGKEGLTYPSFRLVALARA